MNPNVNNPLVLGAIEQALDALLVSLVELDGVRDVEVPVDALDLALRADRPYKEAQQQLVEVLVHVRVALGKDNEQLFLRVEERVNAVVAAATDVGFRLGLSAREGPWR